MTLRPRCARWFEVLTDREHLGAVLRQLGATHAVELEVRSAIDGAGALPDYREVLAEYAELARRYAAYWPSPAVDPEAPPADSLAGARDALARLRTWCEAADAPIARLQRTDGERAALAELAGVLRTAGAALPDPAALCSAGPALAVRLHALSPEAPLELPAELLCQPLEIGGRRYLLAVGLAEHAAELDRRLAAARARAIPLPSSLPSTPTAALAEIDSRLQQLDAQRESLRSTLAALEREHRLAGVLASFRFLDWLVTHVPRLPATEHFAYVTGWTDDLDGRRLAAALERGGAPHLLHFPDPPATLVAPQVLANAKWARPFEPVVRLLGTPAAGEADPTSLVALLAPLLFGFMFGDVGHGLVLLAVGLAGRRRHPGLALLVPGGAAAILFGFAFGSVFAREDVLPALWLHPLEAPLAILLTTVALGVVVITAGLGLDWRQHAWRGEGARWWVRRGGIVLLYAGLLATPFGALGWTLIAGGIAWHAAGAGASDRRLPAMGAALGELVETVLQLVVNTVSFARVGAFALAHAGLSVAVVGLADAAGAGVGYWIALVLGNVLILVLEGMVVAIQATRLVLFEFFIRFLRADGRPFRPLADPGAGTLASRE